MLYIVVGMHRSGTSLVSRLLHDAGIVMGKNFKPAANRHNPHGYYEDFEFRKLNDALLSAAGYDVKTWKLPVVSADKATEELSKRMARLLVKRGRARKWGWKDPRQCLTHSAWKGALAKHDHSILYVFRHPVAVASSLINRGNISAIEHGVTLWYEYNRAALNSVAYTGDILFVSYESVVYGHGIESVADFVGRTLNRSAVDDRLLRQVDTGVEISNEAADMYSLLLSMTN